MTTSLTDSGSNAILKKMTASFSSRSEAKKAIRVLRQSGYPPQSIRILHSPNRASLDRKGFYDIFAKYLRHLGDPRHVLIGITHTDLDTATRIFLDMGAEVAVNRFFHQNWGYMANQNKMEEPFRIWQE